MTNLMSFIENQAVETSKSNIRIGFVAQVILRVGVVPRFAKALEKPKCFAAYSTGETADDTKAKAIAQTKKVTGEDHSDFFPALWIEVVPDTSLTPASKYRGSFLSIETPNKKNPRTLKEHGRFAATYMTPELHEQLGEKVWVHIGWQRLTAKFGGELNLLGDDASDELSVIVTRLDNKRAALKLVSQLREQEIDTDDLALAAGYPVQEVRDALRAAAGKGGAKAEEAAPALTVMSAMTASNYPTIDMFLSSSTIEFLEEEYQRSNGSLESVSMQCGASVGDVAIVLNKPEFFKDLMASSGLGEQEALVKVASDTDVHGPDLAVFLEIDEAPF